MAKAAARTNAFAFVILDPELPIIVNLAQIILGAENLMILLLLVALMGAVLSGALCWSLGHIGMLAGAALGASFMTFLAGHFLVYGPAARR